MAEGVQGKPRAKRTSDNSPPPPSAVATLGLGLGVSKVSLWEEAFLSPSAEEELVAERVCAGAAHRLALVHGISAHFVVGQGFHRA